MAGRSRGFHGGEQVNALVRRHPRVVKGAKTVMVMRSAERMDRIFPEWLRNNFDDQGNYHMDDMNQPMYIPKRANGAADFDNDTPITEIGQLTAQMIGRGMRLHHVKPAVIFASPALRCVQTAHQIIRGIELEVDPNAAKSGIKICIEPGLFEWQKWYQKAPNFLTIRDFVEMEYEVDSSYRPVISYPGEWGTETVADFYRRIGHVTKEIVDRKTPADSGISLLVCHATTMDAAVRSLVGRDHQPLADEDMNHMGIHYPYTANLSLIRRDGDWQFMHDLLPPVNYVSLTTRPNARFVNRAVVAAGQRAQPSMRL